MKVQQPIPALAPYVCHYWLSHERVDTRHLVYPDGCVDAVLEIGRNTTTLIYGPATQRATCPAFAGYHYLGICFRPGQARHWLDLPLCQFTDTGVDAGGLAGLDAVELAEHIACGTVFQRLDAQLMSRLERRFAANDRIDRALRVIDLNHGRVRLESLASNLGVSTRQMERQFLDQVGLTPKTYARIRRLRSALTLLHNQPGTLVDVALQAGYADQSHLNRDFKKFLGQSPGSLTDVAFVQDPAFARDYIA